MGLSRRRASAVPSAIWPGFVDAMTGLLLVMMFVLTIFMIVQFLLRERVSGQESQMGLLSAEIAALTNALGLAEAESASLSEQALALQNQLGLRDSEILALQQQETELSTSLANIRAELESSLGEEERLAILLNEIEAELGIERAQLSEVRAELEQTREDAELNRARLEAELASAVIALRDEAEARGGAEAGQAAARQQVRELNAQLAIIRGQLASLQALFDAEEAEADDQAQRIDILTTRLNQALIDQATAERRQRELEAEARAREAEERARLAEEASQLAQEARQLERYRSEFFGALREVLSEVDGVSIEGDRFVISSEVLFPVGSDQIGSSGEAEIAKVAEILKDVSGRIPEEIDWLLRVDGHTDASPLLPGARYRDNWELSQARALSVVRLMVEEFGFPAERLSANGFGEFRPLEEGNSPEALAANRRIEFKLTGR